MASSAAPTKEQDDDDILTTINEDVMITHIFNKLDGPSLATTCCVSTSLRRTCTDQSLWTHICHATWPSTRAPIMRRFISTYPKNGPRAFFSHAFPIFLISPSCHLPAPGNLHIQSFRARLISAVDLYYKNKPQFSTVKVTDAFTWSRFGISVLGPAPAVSAPIDGACDDTRFEDLQENLRMSWILIDPAARRAVNVTSRRAVTVKQRRNGEIELTYPTIMTAGAGDRKGMELVLCRPVVRWTEEAGKVVGAMEVRLEMEDVDGMKLNGRDSLGILLRAMVNCCGGCGWKKSGVRGEEEGRKRYEEFMKMKRKKRFWDRLDKMSVVVPVVVCSVLLVFEFFILLYLFIFEGLGTDTEGKHSERPSTPPPFHDLVEVFIYYL